MSTAIGNAVMQPHAKVYKPHAVPDDAIDPRWLAVRDHLQKSIQDQHDEMEQTRYDLQALKMIHKNLRGDFEKSLAELKSAHDINALLQSKLGSCEAELKSKDVHIAGCMKDLKKCLANEKQAQQELLNSQLKCHKVKQERDTERLKNEELRRAVSEFTQECGDLRLCVEDLQDQLRTITLVKANRVESDDPDDDEDLMLVLEENDDEADEGNEDDGTDDSDDLEYVIDTGTDLSNGHANGPCASTSEAGTLAHRNHLLLGDNLDLKSSLRAREKELNILKQALHDPVVAYAKLEQSLKDNESMVKLLDIYKRLLEDKADAWLTDKSVLQALWKAHFLKHCPKNGWVQPKAFEERRATFNQGKAWVKAGSDNTKSTTAKPKAKSLFLATIKAASTDERVADTDDAPAKDSGSVHELTTNNVSQEAGTTKVKSSYDARTILWSDSDDDLELIGNGGGNCKADVLATTSWSELRDANWPNGGGAVRNGEASLLDL